MLYSLLTLVTTTIIVQRERLLVLPPPPPPPQLGGFRGFPSPTSSDPTKSCALQAEFSAGSADAIIHAQE